MCIMETTNKTRRPSLVDQTGTPGFVRGLHDAHKDAGKMDEKKILNYVIPLAEDGFEVDSELERSLKLYGSDVDRGFIGFEVLFSQFIIDLFRNTFTDFIVKIIRTIISNAA